MQISAVHGSVRQHTRLAGVWDETGWRAGLRRGAAGPIAACTGLPSIMPGALSDMPAQVCRQQRKKNRARGSADAGPRTWCRTGRTRIARTLPSSSMQPAAHSPAPRHWSGAPQRCAARLSTISLISLAPADAAAVKAWRAPAQRRLECNDCGRLADRPARSW